MLIDIEYIPIHNLEIASVRALARATVKIDPVDVSYIR